MTITAFRAAAALTLLMAAVPALAQSPRATAGRGGAAVRPSEAFPIIEFTVTTGDDDLRSDSLAYALVDFPDGAHLRCLLSGTPSDGWGNGSSHSVPCHLDKPRTVRELKTSRITIKLSDGAQVLGSGDNWNIQRVSIVAYAPTSPNRTCIVRVGGSPLARINSAAGVTVTDFPNGC